MRYASDPVLSDSWHYVNSSSHKVVSWEGLSDVQTWCSKGDTAEFTLHFQISLYTSRYSFWNCSKLRSSLVHLDFVWRKVARYSSHMIVHEFVVKQIAVSSRIAGWEDELEIQTWRGEISTEDVTRHPEGLDWDFISSFLDCKVIGMWGPRRRLISRLFPGNASQLFQPASDPTRQAIFPIRTSVGCVVLYYETQFALSFQHTPHLKNSRRRSCVCFHLCCACLRGETLLTHLHSPIVPRHYSHHCKTHLKPSLLLEIFKLMLLR